MCIVIFLKKRDFFRKICADYIHTFHFILALYVAMS